MIQVKRGSTQKWSGVTLESGQPGYDKTKNKIKIGDGKTEWFGLPYASGLHAEEILCSETEAKAMQNEDTDAAAKIADKYKSTTNIITYGTEAPNENTIGQIYLQQYDEPEVDYIVEAGINGIWSYQKWKHGFARCWCRLPITAYIQTPLGSTGLYQDSSSMERIEYPFTFNTTPTETATLQSSSSVVWLSGKTANTTNATGTYALISPDSVLASNYFISLQVEGFWR